jgi:hypothetical protein
MASVKLQATLTGYTAWCLVKLAAQKGKTQAEIASYLMERWVDDNPKYLREYGLTRSAFELEEDGGKVVQIERSKDG